MVNVVDNMCAYWVADPTLQPGWIVFTDASLSYWMHDFDLLLAALEQRIAALEEQQSQS